MQNAGIAALGLNWRYLAFDVHQDDLRQAIEGAKAMRFLGLNLTVPHKLLAMTMVDILDESARAWGAVNTIRFEARNGQSEWQPLRDFAELPREIRTHGFNTDADAIARALHDELDFQPRGAKILLLGAGGAGRTAALKLASQLPAELFLVNRTAARAEAVAQEIHQRHPDVKLTCGYPSGSIDLVLNATSLGLQQNDPVPFDEKQFSIRRAASVFDMVYRPAETALLKSAKSAGCRVANGLGMLLYQGAKALEIWSGQAAPVQIMRQALAANVYGAHSPAG
jgi:shikimate dehydrogenase